MAKRISRRKFMAWSAAMAASAGIIPLVGGCSTAPPSPTQAPAKPAEPTKAAGSAPAPTAAPAAGAPVPGGTLRSTIGNDAKTLDPHKQSTIFDIHVRDNIFEGLMDDDLTEAKGALAEKWESPDAKVYTFYLKKGAKFHDGTEVTAEEVKFSFDRVMNKDTGATASSTNVTSQIANLTVVDKYTVKMELKQPRAAFLSEVGDVKIVPKSFNPDKPVGTGPFAFAEWVRNQKLTLKKFPDYHVKGLPYLDQVVFTPTPDEDQKVTLLQTGQVDFTDTVPLPRVKEAKQSGKYQVIGIPAGVSPAAYWMDINTKVAPLNDARVRRALSYAIDRKAILDITFGEGTIKSSLVPPKHWAFNPNALSFNDRDVNKAKQLLAEAGQSKGFTVQIKQITSRAEFATIAQLIQANWADIGVKAEIVPLELGVWVEQVQNKKDFQIGLTGLTPLYDPDPLMSRPYNNATQWTNEEYTKTLAQAAATMNREERKKLYARAQEIAQEETPAIVVNERPILYGASPAVQGFKTDLRQHVHFKEVWLKK